MCGEIYPAGLAPAGYEQVTVADSAIGLSEIPKDVVRADFVVEAQPIRVRVDGTDPDASTGFLYIAASKFTLYGKQALNAFSAIRDGGSSATLGVRYFKKYR